MANGAAVRDRKKEARWRGIVRGQASSGLSVRAYCKQHGLREHGFYWWRRELVRRDAAKSSRPATFVPVQVVKEEPARGEDGRIEIVWPGGWQVRLRGRVDTQALADVLAVLGAQGGEPC